MSDFSLFADEQPNSSTYIPDGPQETWSAAYRPLGIPGDPGSDMIAGLETTDAAAGPAPSISSFQNFTDSIKSDATNLLGGAEGAIKSGYSTIKGAVGTVVGDVTDPLASAAKTYFAYAMVAIIIVGGVLYFAGKSGALKINAIV